MLPAYFRDPERELILSYLEEWDSLKGRSKEQDEHGDLFSLRDRLVDHIIHERFERFPERDVSREPDSPIAFTQDDRDKLHTMSRLIPVDVHSCPA
jgi:hypothetical protein